MCMSCVAQADLLLSGGVLGAAGLRVRALRARRERPVPGPDLPAPRGAASPTADAAVAP